MLYFFLFHEHPGSDDNNVSLIMFYLSPTLSDVLRGLLFYCVALYLQTRIHCDHHHPPVTSTWDCLKGLIVIIIC